MGPIYNPALKPRLTSAVEAVVTAFLWSLAACLAANVLFICALGAAADFSRLALPMWLMDTSALRLYYKLPFYGLASFFSLAAWSTCTRHSGCSDNNAETPEMSLPALARAAGLELKQLLEIRGLQVMEATFDGSTYHYRALPPAAAAPPVKKTAACCGLAAAAPDLPCREKGAMPLYLPAACIPRAIRIAFFSGEAPACAESGAYFYGETVRDLLLKRPSPSAGMPCGGEEAACTLETRRGCGGEALELLLPREQERLHFFSHREGELCPGFARCYILCCDDFTIDTLACSITPGSSGGILDFFEALEGLCCGLVHTLSLQGLFHVFFPWSAARRVLIVPVVVYWAGAWQLLLAGRHCGGNPAHQLAAPGPDARLGEGFNIPLCRKANLIEKHGQPPILYGI
ncbi:MAG: hypothetical protein GX890_06825 [Firmicutes bacterium]|nr:hypothetical protein [Bacillota bacterium]HPU02008.1 hypothetical protein [Bacillota bacterium]